MMRCGCSVDTLMYLQVDVVECSVCEATWQLLAERIVQAWVLVPGSAPLPGEELL